LGGSWVVESDMDETLLQQYRRLGDDLVPVENPDDDLHESDVNGSNGDAGQ